MARNTIYATVKDGHLNDSAELELLATFATHEGKQIGITVERKRKKRSLSQNAYYWGVVIPPIQALLNEYGNDVDEEETHGFLREHIGKLTSSVFDKDGRRMAIVKSSTGLSTAEFEEYMLKVRAWAAGEGVQILEPNELEKPPMGEY